MKKRIVTALLTLSLLLGMLPSAHAASLFPAVTVYEGQFTDVARTDWFYDHVATLYALGLTNGKDSPSTFQPKSNMTVAEIVTTAARLRSLYEYGAAESGAALYRANAAHWYDPYAAYLTAGGVIGSEFEGQWERSATRAEVAHVLANALPADLFPAINAEAVSIGYARRKYITDVTEYTAYQQDILALYRRGIVGGRNGSGSFEPENSIWRCEVAAMVTRLVDSDLRLVLDWRDATPTSLADLVYSDGTLPAAPSATDSNAIDTALRYMLSRGEASLTFDYDSMTKETATALMNAFLQGIRRYSEQDYNCVSTSYYSSGLITISFSNDYDDSSSVYNRRNETFSAALAVRDSLYRDGTLRESMSEYEKAKAYYNWLCGYCTYDGTKQRSHSAYGVFFDQAAVCDGYTAAYNLLLKLEGIECISLASDTENHAWTVALLDGVSYHIDVTWGDQVTYVDEQYFAMTEAESIARFSTP